MTEYLTIRGKDYVFVDKEMHEVLPCACGKPDDGEMALVKFDNGHYTLCHQECLISAEEPKGRE